MRQNKTKLPLYAMFVSLLAVCAWISIPVLEIAFTMQTFAVLLTLGLLGGKRGTLVISAYLLMGAAGLPVFTGFRGGFSSILGVTGGYLLGFLFTGLTFWGVTALFGKKKWAVPLGMVLGLLTCYIFGSLWFQRVYLGGGNSIALGAVMAKCVLPYLLPDLFKLSLALLLTKKLRRAVNNPSHA